MILGIMQPYWFPYVGYFQLVHAVDKFVVYDDVAFINKGWINRNKVLVSNSEKLVTVPLERASQNKRICDINVLSDDKWQRRLISTLRHAYAKAPFYTPVIEVVEQSFAHDNLSISSYALISIVEVFNYLQIKTPEIVHSSIYKNDVLRGQDRIIDICRQEKCATYINLIGGAELYDQNLYTHAGVQLRFLQTEFQEYAQFSEQFIPALSILDILMMNSPEKVNVMLSKYTLAG